MAGRTDAAVRTSEGGGTPAERRRVGFLPLWGGVATLAMLIGMRGSAWPTALFFIAGWVVPILVLWALWWRGVRRCARLLALVIALALLGSVAWVGKHPSPEVAFWDVTGVALPKDVQVTRVERGWYDGRTTIVWFRGEPKVVHALMAQVDERYKAQATSRTMDEDMRDSFSSYDVQWRNAVGWATPIVPDVATPPPWAKPRQSRWVMPRGGGNRGVWFLWDDATGETLVYDGTD